jgi:sugar phosphate isomerase/epimerase
MKLGVITDGISRDLEHALKVMNEHGLEYAELQFVWDKEVGDHSAEEIRRMKELIKRHGVNVVSITRHNFGGLPVKDTTVDSESFKKHMEGLRRCIAMARELETDTVRIMSGRKEMIIFGENGAEQWVASTGSWEKLLELMQSPVKLAESEGITLAVETGNNAMVTSGYLARKFVDDMGSKNLKVIWDIPNTLYCTDIPYPDAYEQLKGCVSHIHIKDSVANIARATVRFCALGTGDLAPYLEPLAAAMRKDGFDRVISYESVYRPTGGTFEDGFRESFPVLKKLFG